jgi:hypothetical protein
MNTRFLATIFTKVLLAVVLVIAGCASPAVNGMKQEAAVVAPVFPPQDVMQSGNYTLFLKLNEAALRECKDDIQCAIALFNLGFVYVYPNSPYYKLMTGLQYFEDLIKKYPQTPWAHLAQSWTELAKKNIAAEASRYRLRNQLKAKETIVKELQTQIEELQTQIEQFKEVDMEADRRRKELQERIERSRQIDMEMDRKERELLQ